MHKITGLKILKIWYLAKDFGTLIQLLRIYSSLASFEGVFVGIISNRGSFLSFSLVTLSSLWENSNELLYIRLENFIRKKVRKYVLLPLK